MHLQHFVLSKLVSKRSVILTRSAASRRIAEVTIDHPRQFRISEASVLKIMLQNFFLILKHIWD